KTGTAQVADENKGYRAKKQYQSSMCGYFPADNPKYALIVVINDPKGAYYAAAVAGPPFREIADRIYASDTQMYNKVSTHLVGNTVNPEAKAGPSKPIKKVYGALGIKALYASKVAKLDTNNGVAYEEFNTVKGIMPDIKGMGLKDALFLAGNAGLKTKVKGSGKVVAQSIVPGAKIGKGLALILELQ
ncbi:MAG: PASTA domain-containing protein, partial [Pedobacter sp.]